MPTEHGTDTTSEESSHEIVYKDDLQVRQAIKNYRYSNSKYIIKRKYIYNKVVKEASTKYFKNKGTVVISEINEWLA